MERKYKNLSKKLGIEKNTKWLGFISQEEAAEEWANMDIAIIPSFQESFGVSAIEAQASGIPVIISNIPGLKETTIPGDSSIVVKRDEREIADNIKNIYFSPYRIEEMGMKGRKYIIDHYEIEDCFKKVEKLFLAII